MHTDKTASLLMRDPWTALSAGRGFGGSLGATLGRVKG